MDPLMGLCLVGNSLLRLAVGLGLCCQPKPGKQLAATSDFDLSSGKNTR